MNFGFEANAIRVLGRIIKNGHLHKGAKPVRDRLWFSACEAEVEYQDKSPAIDVRFDADQDAVINAFELADGHKGTGTVAPQSGLQHHGHYLLTVR